MTDPRKAYSWTLVLLLPLVGCASLNDFHYEKKQTLRAAAAWHECGNADCSSYPKDYKHGWIDGYYDRLTGGKGCPPSIAPAKYWDPDQVLDDCDRRRAAYYSGWQDGDAAASRCPDTHYLRVWESCECPFPRCENPCPCTNVCGSPCATGQCGAGGATTLGEPLEADSGMIEIIRDEPIGTVHEFHDPTIVDPPTVHDGQSSVLEATPVPINDGAERSTDDKTIGRSIGFALPTAEDEEAINALASEDRAMTPHELFDRWHQDI